ncbi:MAG: ribosome-binding factor A [Chromatiales bacterium]|nr:ribosome-binding factor A [Chromatiales bacterium]
MPCVKTPPAAQVGELIQRELAALMPRELSDPRAAQRHHHARSRWRRTCRMPRSFVSPLGGEEQRRPCRGDSIERGRFPAPCAAQARLRLRHRAGHCASSDDDLGRARRRRSSA